MIRRTLVVALLVLGLLGLPTIASAQGGGRSESPVWRLERRATLSADYLAEGPPSGALSNPANGRSGPYAGQVIPGFSAVLDNGDGTYWGFPDNGFGTKANSPDFLLRLYHIAPDWETAKGGSGDIEVKRFLSLRDPDNQIPFDIINGATPERLLTGGDFDVESIVRMPDGTFWIGEEFGPFLLHFSADGVLLAPPVSFVDGFSPQSPYRIPGVTPNVPASRGFEALAGPVRNLIYPIVEGRLNDDPDVKRRWIYEFDTRSASYTGKRWAYETDLDNNVIGDAAIITGRRMLVLERDNFDGPQSVTKKIYEINLGSTDKRGYLNKKLVVDLLYLRNPDLIGEGDGYGTGDPFSFPFQSVETVVPLPGGRLLIANDNNYPGNAARIPGTPDDTELIVITPQRRVPGTANGALVIGHRGASGYRPEHTLEAYELAIRQCADYIEPDLVSTRDGVLVARHENEISGTTDIATRPEFAHLQRTKMIDGVEVTGWFTEDLTLAELKTLRAKERIPEIRPANTVYDGQFEVPTLAEVIELAQANRTCAGREVGIYPETKHPTYFDSIGLSMEEPLVATLRRYGYNGPSAPVYVQSFETRNLRDLNRMTRVKLVQLISCGGAPWDFVVAGDPRTYADLATPAGLAEIASYADGVGICKNVMIPRNADGTLGEPTPVIGDAHAAGLEVHGWTFRAENAFLPTDLRSSDNPAQLGDMESEVKAFLDAGMDGFFTDHPDRGVAATR